MKERLLSKSAFKTASTCPTKLYYYMQGYPSVKEEDEYLKSLARDGHIIGKIAQLKYPDGIEIDRSVSKDLAIAETERLLKTHENLVLFEAALRSGNLIAYVDILVKQGTKLSLIEVKSKGLDSADGEALLYGILGKRGDIVSNFTPYIEDIAFQYVVAKNLFPDSQIACFLRAPDKSFRTSLSDLPALFEVSDNNHVTFLGDPAPLNAEPLLIDADVTTLCQNLETEIRSRAATLASSLSPALTKIDSPLSVTCRKCEYRSTEEDQRSGFNECWGELAHVTPNLFDLTKGTAIKRGVVFNDLIAQRKFSLFDLPLDALTGALAARQHIQIEHTRSGTEYLSSALKSELDTCAYPLFFIDFETARSSIPPHKGLTPYEQIAFQWSCHKIAAPGADPTHHEWLSEDGSFPNFSFAQSLRALCGSTGTFFHWASHEKTVLNDIADQLSQSHSDPALISWLQSLTAGALSLKMVDLEKLTHQHYFHPAMGGRTSLKAVLPAIWNTNGSLKNHPWFSRYTGSIDSSDPYKTLPTKLIAGTPWTVQEGTAAVRAYEAMTRGIGQTDPSAKSALSQLLREYCALDTLAMVLVWKWWISKF